MAGERHLNPFMKFCLFAVEMHTFFFNSQVKPRTSNCLKSCLWKQRKNLLDLNEVMLLEFKEDFAWIIFQTLHGVESLKVKVIAKALASSDDTDADVCLISANLSLRFEFRHVGQGTFSVWCFTWAEAVLDHPAGWSSWRTAQAPGCSALPCPRLGSGQVSGGWSLGPCVQATSVGDRGQGAAGKLSLFPSWLLRDGHQPKEQERGS